MLGVIAILSAFAQNVGLSEVIWPASHPRPVPRAVTYAIVELPTPPSLPYAVPVRINGDGVVVGSASNTLGPFGGRPVAWVERQCRFLSGDGVPAGVNARGDVLLQLRFASASGLTETKPVPSDFAYVSAINDSGDIVGARSGKYSRAIAAIHGSIVEIPTGQSAESMAEDINNLKTVAGWIRDSPGGKMHAFLWNGKGVTHIYPPDMDASGAPIRLNNADQLLCQTTVERGSHREAPVPFVWSSGRTVTLRPANGFDIVSARDMNDRGDVVGSCCRSRDVPGLKATDQPIPLRLERGFIWHNGSARNLNECIKPGSGWVIETATAINNRGEIAGVGVCGGRRRAFLLTPVVAGSRTARSARERRK